MADKALTGYPQSIGGKTESVLDHTGPASYTVVTVGTPPTGGDIISAAAFGLKWIEHMSVTGDNTGTYFVVPIRTGTDPLGSILWTLRWFTAVGAVEVVATTDLSAKHVRIRAIGY